MSETVQGWWFSKLSDPVRLPHGDGRAVVVGEMLSVEEPIVLREHGLHASAKALDALRYAPGMMVARVELSGHIIRGDNKIVATHRKTLWMADATKTLQWFAVWCASRALSRERDAGRVPDKRSLDAVRVTTEYLLGRATKNDVISARAAAADAAAAAAAAYAYADAAADADAAAAAAAADAAYAAAAADAADGGVGGGAAHPPPPPHPPPGAHPPPPPPPPPPPAGVGVGAAYAADAAYAAAVAYAAAAAADADAERVAQNEQLTKMLLELAPKGIESC